ncbi:hypothetical protein ABLV17_16385 [Klebsiella sp. CN_Kp091]|uniref:hypothetical protein n=1 Tax=unclassified Klebsiella TaxID=2608929 RepID=UPI0032B464A8|nr:hypothetical protein [Klebsiella aerogenes]
MTPPKFSNVPRALLPALLLTVFMSSGCFASRIDEPPIDTFCSNDSRELNHITDLMNERGPTSVKISEETTVHPELDELSNKMSLMLLNTVKKGDIEELNSNIKHLITIIESKNNEADISKVGAELNKLTLSKSEIADLMASDIAKEAQTTLVTIDKNSLFRSTILAGKQEVNDVSNDLKQLEDLRKLSIRLEFYLNCFHLFILSIGMISLMTLIVYKYTPIRNILAKLKK